MRNEQGYQFSVFGFQFSVGSGPWETASRPSASPSLWKGRWRGTSRRGGAAAQRGEGREVRGERKGEK